MLSAAHDLLKEDKGADELKDNATSLLTNNTRDCNELSTGTVLLADIIPAIMVKAIAPFLIVNINLKVACVIILNLLSYLLVSLSTTHWLMYIGVVSASLGFYTQISL